jgi:hypothetical protein
VGCDLSALGTLATVWHTVPVLDDDDGDDECGAINGIIDRGNSEKTCPNAALFTTNPT